MPKGGKETKKGKTWTVIVNCKLPRLFSFFSVLGPLPPLGGPGHPIYSIMDHQATRLTGPPEEPTARPHCSDHGCLGAAFDSYFILKLTSIVSENIKQFVNIIKIFNSRSRYIIRNDRVSGRFVKENMTTYCIVNILCDSSLGKIHSVCMCIGRVSPVSG